MGMRVCVCVCVCVADRRSFAPLLGGRGGLKASRGGGGGVGADVPGPPASGGDPPPPVRIVSHIFVRPCYPLPCSVYWMDAAPIGAAATVVKRAFADNGL